jgi:hypothetical protein
MSTDPNRLDSPDQARWNPAARSGPAPGRTSALGSSTGPVRRGRAGR